MLVLSRKEGERIVIGSGIEVVVLNVVGNRVRLGVAAPREIPVHRGELARRLQAEAAIGEDCSLSALPLPDDGLQTCLTLDVDRSPTDSTN